MKFLKSLLLVISSLVIFCIVQQVQKVYASEILFEEDFSTDLSNWEPTRDDGSYWSIVDGEAYSEIFTNSTITELVPKDSKWNNNWKDYEFEFDYTPQEGVDKNVSFRVQDALNFYEVHFISPGSNLVDLHRTKDGNSIFGKQTTYELQNNITYHIKIILNGPEIKLLINGEEVISAYDTTYDDIGGKVGIKAGTGAVTPTKVSFDNIVVRSLDTNLDVPLMMQNDDSWGSEEYDHLQGVSWATTPTIGRYGCAMTSMAMVMNYHGITTFPNGDAITPSTLNTWLQNEPDGYFGEGILNWNAATRLTRIISDHYGGVPKLEYQWKGNNETLAETELENNRPVIFRVPGHFVTAKGFNETTFFINDPFWETRTTLESYDNTYENMRLFQPSFTDLSYITLSFDPTLNVLLQDEVGNPIAYDEYEDGGIVDPVNGDTQPKRKIIQFAKPETGQYQLMVSQNKADSFSFDLFTYDQEANVSVLSQSGYVGSEPQTFVLTYNKNGESSMHQDIDFQQFIQDVHVMREMRYIKSRRLEYTLTRIAQYANQAPASRKLRYARYIETMVARSSRRIITIQGKEYLKQRAGRVRQKYE